jgi:hypothetical protein
MVFFSEKHVEMIVSRVPSLINSNFELVKRQFALYRKLVDVVFIDKDNTVFLVEIKLFAKVKDLDQLLIYGCLFNEIYHNYDNYQLIICCLGYSEDVPYICDEYDIKFVSLPTKDLTKANALRFCELPDEFQKLIRFLQDEGVPLTIKDLARKVCASPKRVELCLGHLALFIPLITSDFVLGEKFYSLAPHFSLNMVYSFEQETKRMQDLVIYEKRKLTKPKPKETKLLNRFYPNRSRSINLPKDLL